MIVRPRPGALDLLFTMRGSIVPRVAPRVLFIALLAMLLAWLHHSGRLRFPEFTVAPFGLLGIALSVFLGFRNNSCYDRWWEARKLWGQLIAESRSFGREVTALFPEDAALRQRLLRRAIGFAAQLAAQLRRADGAAAARPWLPPEEAAALPARRNRGEAILRAQAAELAALRREGRLGDMLYAALAG